MSRGWRHGWRLAAAIGLSLAAWLAASTLLERRLDRQMLLTDPASALADARLLRRADRVAAPIFRRQCTKCHGNLQEVSPSSGVSDLRANHWLYGKDPVALEQTLLYGIRSGHPKARNLTDMPGFVRSGQLTALEASDVVEYVRDLSGQDADANAALRGRTIFFDKGNCFDCHASNARGVTDYGTPALTGPTWLYGGDRASLLSSVADGRHGKCPSWAGVLTPIEIRSMVLYLLEPRRRRPAGPRGDTPFT